MDKWLFPLAGMKVLGETSDSMSFENIDISKEVEIPIGQHVGAFGVKRKMHVHNGVDLYCPPRTLVFAVEGGVVVDIRQWTGKAVGSPWWKDTWAVLVEGESGVAAYGEIEYDWTRFKIGYKIAVGDHIGWVKTVLKKDKGRPMTMLHLQMYKQGHLCSGGWDTNDPKPDNLIDPTPFLLDADFIGEL